MWWYVLVGAIVVFAAIGIVIISTYNKFQFAIIKIDEAENHMDFLLQKKIDLFARIIALLSVKEEADQKMLRDILALKEKKLNNFELHRELSKATHTLHLLLDQEDTITERDTMDGLMDELFHLEEDIEAAMHYYNDNVILFNKLIKCFPSNIIRLLFRYKNKEFYSNEKEEIYEILKN